MLIRTQAISLPTLHPIARELVFATLGAIGLALLAQVRIPLPFTPVPFTMQVLGVLLLGGLLGPRAAGIAVLEYLLLGVCGAPVFTGWGAGFATLTGTTAGYLFAFAPAAVFFAVMTRRYAAYPYGKRVAGYALAALIAIALIHVSGGIWMANYTHSVSLGFAWGVAPFVVMDLLKAGFAVSLLALRDQGGLMRRFAVGVLLLLLTLPGWAEPLTPAAARAITDTAITELVELQRLLSDQYFHTGEWDKTIAALQQATVLDPADIDSYAVMAWLQWSMKHQDAALATFRRLIANNPTNALAHYGVGAHFFLKERNYTESLPYLQQADALANPPLPLPDRHLLALNLEKLNRTDEAIACWQRMLQLDATDEVATRRLAVLQGKQDATSLPQPLD